jgi:hypothetical protein
MAIVKEVEINIDAKDIITKLDKINDQFTELNENSNKTLSDTNKSVKNIEKSTGSLANGLKGVGLAFKAMGVGLVIEAFNVLKDLFMSNQTIADGFGVALKSLGIVFNDLFNFITNNAGKVVDFFKGIFNDPQQAIKDFGKLVKENLIERFVSLLEVTSFLGKALQNLFAGEFRKAIDNVKEAGKEMVDVFTGVDGTTEKVADLANEVGKYASSVFESAKALQAQENSAKLAVAQQQRLVEQYDRQAEKLRQVRDNDLISIDDRIKANEKLGEVLGNQQKAMLGVANAQIAQAQNQLSLNKSIENQVALINALANKDAILAQIEGFRSEQLVNRISLEKELLDLGKARSEGETQLAINAKLFDAERKKDDEKKLEAQKEAIENQKRLELERLQTNIDLYKQGTQARVDAENEFALKKQELDNALLAKQDEIIAFREAKILTDAQRLYENENLTYAERLLALDNYNALVENSVSISEEKKREIQGNTLEYEKMLQRQRIDLVGNSFGEIAQLLGEQTKAGKAFAIAQALINTYQGISNVWAEKSESGLVGLGLAQRILTTGIVAAKGFATVKKIMSVSAKGGGGGGSMSTGGGGGVPSVAPVFNTIGGSPVNQLAQAIGDQPPVQAFVVGSQVTSQQALDRNIIQNASLG